MPSGSVLVKSLCGSVKYPVTVALEMHDQDADQRCGTDKIKIKQALLLMGGLPFYFCSL